MEVRPGYKRTEVGVIPEDWNYTSIASVARLESGHTPSKRKPSYWGGSVQWVSLHDTAALEDQEIAATAKTITEDGLNHSSARLLPAGTVVFSRTATVGKSTVMATSMATSQDFANYICGPELHNHFLVHLFRGMGRTWQRFMAGSIHNTIYMPVFKALKIVLPPPPEQRAIAAALSDVDALLGGLNRLIAKKRDLKQAAMQQLLTGQTRLSGFHSEWATECLGDQVTRFVGGGTPSRGNPTYWGGEIPWVTVKDFATFDPQRTQESITSLGLESSSSHLIPAGTVITSTRMALGKTVIYDVDVAINQDLKALFLKPCLFSEFLRFWFEYFGSSIDSLGSGSTVKGISIAELARFPFYRPALQEQVAITAVLADMDAELAALEARCDKTRTLKQGMMQELLTGRTRLIETKRESAAAC